MIPFIYRRLLHRTRRLRKYKKKLECLRRESVSEQKKNSIANWLVNITLPFVLVQAVYPQMALLDMAVVLICLICYTGLIFVCNKLVDEMNNAPLLPVSLSKSEKRRHRAERILVTIDGAGPHKVSIALHPTSRFEDLASELRKRRLVPDLSFHRRLQYTFVFPGAKKRDIELSETLHDVGVRNLSLIHLRYNVLGGSKRPTPATSDSEGEASPSGHPMRPTGKANRRPDVWETTADGSLRCRICHTERTFKSNQHIKRHEKSELHRASLKRHNEAIAASSAQTEPTPPMSMFASTSAASQMLDNASRPLAEDRLTQAVYELITGSHETSYDPDTYGTRSHDSGTSQIDWEAPEMQAADLTADPRLDSQYTLNVAAEQLREFVGSMRDISDEASDASDCEADDWPDDDGAESSDWVDDATDLRPPKPPPCAQEEGNPWYPWPNKQTCVLDILRHLPRCSFSRKQNSAIHWALQALGVENLPSDRSMDEIDSLLQRMCGIRSVRHEGKLGHVYYVNDLAGIIAQEMANPNVRDKLHFYPEDTAPCVSEAWQAERWLHELDPALTTPMVRKGNQDFYIYEPTLMRDRSVCMPIRWFMRGTATYAQAWRMRAVQSNGTSGWLVLNDNIVTMSLDNALLSLPHFADSYFYHDLADPSNILGCTDHSGHRNTPWTLTDPRVGNPWRQKSKGHRSVAFPTWLYCDDTSGNVSKKWNKHNSFLFTAAGLPREEVHKESNIHFLCTSNIAAPLEMLDGVVEHIEHAQQDGIWVWDAIWKELVLVIPSVLAFLGDNPMQSEMACHIGFRGRLFCRMCKVSGASDGADEADEDASAPPADVDSDASESNRTHTTKGKKRADETMEDLMKRVENFMRMGEPRSRSETEAEIASQFTQACSAGGKTAYKRMKTESGVKDTFLEQLLERYGVFAASTRKGRSKRNRQDDVDKIVKDLPHPCTSPVWRIRDLDPHRDTPVEILHTVLLGFVKYFWRDALTRVKKADHATLINRLSSIDVSGLNVPPLSGHTLVTYGRSLTGRDFRVLAQVAPFVLQGLIEDDRLRAWVSLSAVVTLVWRPEISDINGYIAKLRAAIDNFLDDVCALTPQWFNKPKFHILLHLPDHVRRFGPAMLFATEGFESYNAIIRSASVHSNRHAPSRDIALQMARASRVRHLLSGGYFFVKPERAEKDHALSDASWNRLQPGAGKSDALEMKVIGKPVKSLLDIQTFGVRHVGLPRADGAGQMDHKTGASVDAPPALTPFAQTAHARCGVVPPSVDGTAVPTAQSPARSPESVILQDGSRCSVLDWVVWDETVAGACYRRIGRVQECLQLVGSEAERDGIVNGVLVQRALCGDNHGAYRMPQIQLLQEFVSLKPKALLAVVNVQHNCHDNDCKIEAMGHVVQEREQREERTFRVRHQSKPAATEFILNTAQMRSSSTLDPFRRAIPRHRTRTDIIFDAARKVADLKKKTRQHTALAGAIQSGPSQLPLVAHSISSPLSDASSTAPFMSN